MSSKVDHARIYAENAAGYERLVGREDYRGSILTAVRQIRDLEGLEVVELGAGTGRLTCLLAPMVKSIAAFDISSHMLELAATKLRRAGRQNCGLAVADNRALPVDAQVANLVISGWSIVYTVVWNKETWRHELERTLAQMKRVLRPGGTIMILETLGTGYETPTPPDEMVAYLDSLDRAGFSFTWIRTDFLFRSLEEAQELTTFFFGEEMITRLISTDPVILPECTGIWWLDL
jgi:ubiquinone/menaquinone biosynthesis C-methylase UbiE